VSQTSQVMHANSPQGRALPCLESRHEHVENLCIVFQRLTKWNVHCWWLLNPKACRSDTVCCGTWVSAVWCFVDHASWYINESTRTWYNFLSLFIRSQCLYMFRALLANRNMHAVNTHPTHVITPNYICAEPPEDERVTPKTCRGTGS
jgi:hypothetical protein